MNNIANKIISSLIPVLIQSVVVLAIVAVVFTSYVDNRITALTEHVDQTKQPEIKILSLLDMVQKLQKNGYDEKETPVHVSRIIKYYRDNGYLVLDLDSVVTAPRGMAAKIPSMKELDAIR